MCMFCDVMYSRLEEYVRQEAHEVHAHYGRGEIRELANHLLDCLAEEMIATFLERRTQEKKP